MSESEAGQRLLEFNFTLFYFGGSSGRGGFFDDEVEGIDYLPPFGTHWKGFQGKVTFQSSGTQSTFLLDQFLDCAGLGKMRHISVFFLPQFQGFVQQFHHFIFPGKRLIGFRRKTSGIMSCFLVVAGDYEFFQDLF